MVLGSGVGFIVVLDVVFAVVLVVFWVVFAVVTVDFIVVPDVVAVDFVTVVGFVVGWSLGLLHLSFKAFHLKGYPLPFLAWPLPELHKKWTIDMQKKVSFKPALFCKFLLPWHEYGATIGNIDSVCEAVTSQGKDQELLLDHWQDPQSQMKAILPQS